MNKWMGMGRLTQEVIVKYSAGNNTPVLRNCIAIDRPLSSEAKKAGKKKETDFINIIAFKNNAENIGKYFKKGSKIAIEGRLQSGSYDDKDGKKVYTTDVIVEIWEFVESSKNESKEEVIGAPVGADGFVNVDDVTAELPFFME